MVVHIKLLNHFVLTCIYPLNLVDISRTNIVYFAEQCNVL